MLTSIGRLSARIRAAAYAVAAVLPGVRLGQIQTGTAILTEDGHPLLAEDGTQLLFD